METTGNTEGRGARLFELMNRRPWMVFGLAIAVTALLAIPFLTMEPDSTASGEPGGPVFEARDAIDARFVSSVVQTPIIFEARGGDVLAKEALIELRDNSASLRVDPELGPLLFSYFDRDTGVDVTGILTVADLVDRALPGGIEGASQGEIDAVVAGLIDEFGVASQALGLSVGTAFDTGADRWVAPAVFASVVSDNNQLGFANTGVTLGADTEPEEYARKVVDRLRGDQTSIAAWGVAIDVNLTSQEQGQEAGPFIGLTILAVLIIVGIAFRSYWVLAVTGVSLGALIVWLFGISNLIGLEDDLVLGLIVPIAMISFGVDFAFHAVGRYREERRLGYSPRRAFTVGLTAVIGALALALASDSVAFLSNTASGIESIIQFGVSVTIGLVAAFLLLGIVTPLAISVIEARVGTPPTSQVRTVGRIAASATAASLAMTTVLLLVFIFPPAGVVALGISLIATILLPVRFSTQRSAVEERAGDSGPGRIASVIGSVVAVIASRKAFVLPLAGIATLGAVLLAVQVPTEFDVKDFFASDVDFVVSLDKVDEHIGELGGEPALIYVEADLTDPAVNARLVGFRDDIAGIESATLANDGSGSTRVEGSVLEVIDEAWLSPPTLSALSSFGVELTDVDGDGIPDNREQLSALLAYSRQAGIAFDETRFVLTPDDVRGRVWVSEDGASSATTFAIRLTNTRRQEGVSEARAAVTPFIDRLRADLQAGDPEAVVQLAGGPIVRQESLEAISRALQISLPIAVVLCLLIAAAFLRSFRLGVVVVLPILMTVTWLYAFMYVFGFAINLVTATIGAVSIGIGIDYAIHYTVRFREELVGASDRLDAVRRAGEGTGLALVASALSSVVGFLILALAPMPLFASYGLLTAVMIALALTATLLVLPSLLVAVTRDTTPVPQLIEELVPA